MKKLSFIILTIVFISCSQVEKTKSNEAEIFSVTLKINEKKHKLTYDTNIKIGTIYLPQDTVIPDFIKVKKIIFSNNAEISTSVGEELLLISGKTHIDITSEDGSTSGIYEMKLKVWIRSYEVNFDSNGGTIIDSFIAGINTTISPPPVSPIKLGYVFLGWYKDGRFNQKFIFDNDRIIQETTLYAKWQSAGGAFKVDDSGFIIDLKNEFKSMFKIDLFLPSSIFGQQIVGIKTRAFKGYTNITSVTFEEGSLGIIGQEAFLDCNRVTSVEISSTVTEIEAYAFKNCVSLRTININTAITTISEGMFYNCTVLKAIKLSASIESIEADAFKNCSSLTMTIFKDTPPKLAPNSLEGVKRIIVPSSALDNFKTATNWSKYSTIIVTN